jgi:hypothetical protein
MFGAIEIYSQIIVDLHKLVNLWNNHVMLTSEYNYLLADCIYLFDFIWLKFYYFRQLEKTIENNKIFFIIFGSQLKIIDNIFFYFRWPRKPPKTTVFSAVDLIFSEIFSVAHYRRK